MSRALQIDNYDWECEDSDTQYLTHSIHRYSGKFIPQIARNAIELATKKGDLVLDPYCGSGTTLLECALCGRQSIGLDLNPLAILISKVKVTPTPGKLIDKFRNELLEGIYPIVEFSSNQIGLFNKNRSIINELRPVISEDPKWDDPFFQKWFQDDVRAELIWIFNEINSIQDEAFKNMALVAFSDILRKSSNAHSSYPNVMFDKKKGKVPPATPNFIKRFDEVLSAVKKLEALINRVDLSQITIGSARKVPYKDNCFDAIITHPPYIGSVPYAEYGLLSLKWLGYDPKALDDNLTGGRRQSKNVVARFKEGFNDMIHESWRVLKKRGKLFMLLGSPTVKGEIVDLPAMAIKFAESAKFSLVGIHYRNGINRRANKMGAEAVMFFEK